MRERERERERKKGKRKKEYMRERWEAVVAQLTERMLPKRDYPDSNPTIGKFY